jgi:hypothetical protein
MSITGPAITVLVTLICVSTLVGVLVFIYYRKHHDVKQRITDEEGQSSCKIASD